MARLHTLYLPGNGEGMPFAFILDQANPMTDQAITAWQSFANHCGARDIMFTTETIDTDPELSDGWEPDEPVGYTPADAPGARVIGLPDLMHMVQAAHAAAWEEWAPANLDPESPKVMTHREDACPALNGSVLGCPMHEVFEGPWSAWPYFASRTAESGGVVTRICDHGVTHPTPEEYVGGFDTPHLCDGCPCANDEDRDRYTIVVSDLANTKLPRGTLLLGVKDDPTPVTAPPADGWTQLATSEAEAENWGTARIQPLGADGEPIAEAKDYPLAGPVTITEKQYPTVDLQDVRDAQCAKDAGGGRCLKPTGHEGECEAYNSFTDTLPVEKLPYYFAETTQQCAAGGADTQCTLDHGHEGLHDFGPFTRI